MKFAASEITALQSRLTARWHEAAPDPAPAGSDAFAGLVEQNHRRNFQLWHEEDVARRDDLGFEAVYRAKRNIDRLNQERNDFVERMDHALVAALRPADDGCPRNSETPGMMIDRLSILALKAYHMQEEAERASATAEHRATCATRLARIRRQVADLAACLDELIADVTARRRTFSVYYQFKMYNDPALNPQLYGGREKR
jgi:hypothetical protein